MTFITSDNDDHVEPDEPVPSVFYCFVVHLSFWGFCFALSFWTIGFLPLFKMHPFEMMTPFGVIVFTSMFIWFSWRTATEYVKKQRELAASIH